MNSEKDKVNKKLNIGIIAILICICIFHAVSNYVWIKKDVLSWYPEKYYLLTYKNIIFFSIKNIIYGDSSFLDKFTSVAKLINRNSLGWGWGVAYYIYTSCINLILGNNINVSLITNIPVFILLIIFIFLIGKKIAGEREGILAAFLIAFYPGIYGMSRSYGVDFPLILMVTISLYLIIAKDITKISYFLLLGLITGLTVLIKGTGVYFFIGPIILVFSQHIRDLIKNKQEYNDRDRYVLRMILAFGLFVALFLYFFNLVWQIPLNKYLLKYMCHIAFYPIFMQRRHFYWVSPYDTFDMRSIFFYASEMMHSMSKALSLFFFLGFLLFFKSKLKDKNIIYLWVLIPYIIFTLNINKWGRYYFPALPAIALITAVGVLRIRSKKYKAVLVTIIVSVSLLQFYDLSFGTNILPKILYKHPDYSFVAYPPQKCEDSKAITRFLETINKENRISNYRTKILFVAPHDIIDYGRLEYILQEKEANIEFAKFFTAGHTYKQYDYIIILNRRIADSYKPDLSFLIIPEYYRDFLKVSFRRYLLSNEQLKEMHDTFIKFKLIDSYFSNDFSFYLCKNNK